ncbi:MAG: tetratricopeptide repeat protein [Rhodospirillales bacterium]
MSIGMKDLLAAAEKGDATSQFNLGVVHDNLLNDTGSHGSKSNRAEAIKWLLQAAEQGMPRAQVRLAKIYAGGPEASGDDVRACTWFLLAAMRLSGAQRDSAQSGYDRIARHMAPAQIAKAQRLARLWKPPLKLQDTVALAASP